MEVWIAVDNKTGRLVGFGTQSEAQVAANSHMKLSGNMTVTRKLSVGMTIGDYE